MRRLAAFIAIAWVFCFANQPALAGKRVATVIGNSNYQSVAALANPVNDSCRALREFTPPTAPILP